VNVAAEPRPLEAGAEVLPGYRVVEHLRRGSALDVYDVWSTQRQCSCIAKVIRPDRIDNPAVRRRLLTEGRLLMRLAHPHIVRAYELHQRPQPALILETLTGATLDCLLEGAPRGLGAADVAILGLQLISAVHYLHINGVLHLDLKPSNIVAEGSATKLLDLDIAQAPGRSRGWGTRRYMAPEQMRGNHVTAATDVWGIGMVLFEVLTGRHPFDGPARTPPRIAFRRGVPAGLRCALTQALDPEPANRPTLEQLTTVLRALLSDAGIVAA
jgi:eukaryotic-like serine/threonine-protein kinase